MPVQRVLVRVLVGTALIAALSASAAIPVPETLPAVALGQNALYRLEIALAAFYGLLLLVTPAYSGLTAGRLPIEISTRGAKFAEEANEAAGSNEKAIESLERAVDQVVDELSDALVEIDGLRDRDRR